MKDRNAWRTSIEDGNFDPQVETLTWGGKLETHPRMIKTEPAEAAADEEDNGSEASSSVDGAETVTGTAPKKNVASLACALLQLAQSLETKYLKKPLGKDSATVFLSLAFDFIFNKRICS